VDVQRALLGKAFATLLTAVRFLPGVHALVQLQIRLLGETLPAHGAAERLLARVSPDVNLQTAEVVEDLAAEQALKGFQRLPDALVRGQMFTAVAAAAVVVVVVVVLGVVHTVRVSPRRGLGGVGVVHEGAQPGVFYQMLDERHGRLGALLLRLCLRLLCLRLRLAAGAQREVVQISGLKTEFVGRVSVEGALLERGPACEVGRGKVFKTNLRLQTQPRHWLSWCYREEEHTFPVIPGSHLLADGLVVVRLLFNKYEVGIAVQQADRLQCTERTVTKQRSLTRPCTTHLSHHSNCRGTDGFRGSSLGELGIDREALCVAGTLGEPFSRSETVRDVCVPLLIVLVFNRMRVGLCCDCKIRYHLSR